MALTVAKHDLLIAERLSDSRLRVEVDEKRIVRHKDTDEKLPADVILIRDGRNQKFRVVSVPTPIVNHNTNNNGYHRIRHYLGPELGRIYFLAHRIVAVEVFGLMACQGMDVNHIDKRRWNFCRWNLELLSHAANLMKMDIRGFYRNCPVPDEELPDEQEEELPF